MFLKRTHHNQADSPVPNPARYATSFKHIMHRYRWALSFPVAAPRSYRHHHHHHHLFSVLYFLRKKNPRFFTMLAPSRPARTPHSRRGPIASLDRRIIFCIRQGNIFSDQYPTALPSTGLARVSSDDPYGSVSIHDCSLLDYSTCTHCTQGMCLYQL